MRVIFIMLILIATSSVSASFFTTQGEPQRFLYHVWGDVSDEQARMIPSLTVCFVPAECPINGRIPCTKTDVAGSFAMSVKGIPDKYIVCASTTDSPFIFEQDKDKGHRVTCSKPIQFGANDECRKVTLQFEAK